MATTLKFDELHRLDYRDYFGRMYITPSQMRSRISMARDIESVIVYMFAYWRIARDAEIPIAEVKKDVEQKLTAVVEKRTKLDPYLKEHISQVVDEVVDSTERQTKKKRGQDELDDEKALNDFLLTDADSLEARLDEDEESEEDEQNYWTSRERAMFISANEANAFENYLDYKKAVEQGKTKKTWITMLDERVRETHMLAEGQTVKIDGLFLVGGSKMRFPMDTMYGASPRETIRCRCSCDYE